MADTWTVVATSVYIRSKPKADASKLGAVYNGQTIEVTELSGSWVKHGAGWSCATSASGKSYIVRTTIAQPDPDEPQASPPATDSTSESAARQEENLREYEEENLVRNGLTPDMSRYDINSVTNTEEYLNSIENSLSVTSCRGIHGMPYQFMPIADTRISKGEDSFGRKYAEKIVARMPILCLTPGTPVFLEGYDDSTKRSIKNMFIDFASSGTRDSLDELLSGNGKFYSIKFDYKGYYDYVNAMCRNAAHFMGIEDTVISGQRLSTIDWGGGDIKTDLSKVIKYTDCVAFYIDSEKSISESFGNDTSESMLKSSVNSMSDGGRELQYLLGTVKSGTGVAFDKFTNQENLAKNMENVDDFITGVLGEGNGNIFKRITGNIQTIASGGRMIFPEVWSDSSFGRSFSISQTLVSPDTDDLSVYLNIIVPMLHWIALTAPRSATSSGYIAPYMVRGFYKGLFNVDMGIITGLGFTKGEEGSWTRSGLPTIVKVSADIKDLYSSMAISDTKNGQISTFNNTILMDYLANLCGININEPDVMRNIDMYLMAQGNKIRDAIRFDVFRGLEQSWSNSVHKLYRNMFF